jgi:hypothetical protein
MLSGIVTWNNRDSFFSRDCLCRAKGTEIRLYFSVLYFYIFLPYSHYYQPSSSVLPTRRETVLEKMASMYAAACLDCLRLRSEPLLPVTL